VLENLFSLTGKRALVAGASRGIGLAIAKALAGAGAEVILAARSFDKLKEEAAALKGYALQLDISSSDSVYEAARAAGDVDILVNVAGTNVRKAFEDYNPDEYRHILDTNLNGIVELTQHVGRRMIARRKGGKVINIGSLMSLRGLPYLSIYAITKGGIAQLTMALAAEWGRDNIQVNCIAPGFILTSLNQKMWEQKGMKEWLRASQANPEMGTPEDIAPLAVFLAGRGSNYITGQVIAVDGGYTTTAAWPFQP
jgi:gluconate 5-dehydrogenase